MAAATLGLPQSLIDYMHAHALRETDVLRQLRDRTSKLEHGHWQMVPEQGQFMALLAKIAGTRSYLELGCFTGYGTLWITQALPKDAEIISCERFEEFAAIAREYWERAGVRDRIDLRMVDAIHVLDQLLKERGENALDMIFIDADKKPYPEYYARAVRLVRPGGLVLVDNAFRGGAVVDPDDSSKATRAIRDVTDTIHLDDRVDMSLVPISDGLIIARKR